MDVDDGPRKMMNPLQTPAVLASVVDVASFPSEVFGDCGCASAASIVSALSLTQSSHSTSGAAGRDHEPQMFPLAFPSLQVGFAAVGAGVVSCVTL